MIRVVSTVAGAGQFSAAAAIVTFIEQTNVNLLPSHVGARIMGYSYNSLGAAHDATLTLASAAGVAVNLQINLEVQTGINSFSEICGPDGIVVPRDGNGSGNTFVVLFSTVGKANDGTFQLWYTIGNIDQHG